MSLSLRIPPDKEELIQKASRKAGKTKSAFIIEAIDEKLGLAKSKEQLIRSYQSQCGPKIRNYLFVFV